MSNTPTFNRDELVKVAIEARKGAYAPYSNYDVGAALLLANGEVVTGANVENAVYPAGCCAERVAMYKAAADQQRQFTAMAIATRNGGTPCGICRQVMREFAPALIVLLVDGAGKVEETTLEILLPDAFGPDDL